MAHERPRQREPLTLTARQRHSPLTEFGGDAVGQRGDELRCLGGVERVPEFAIADLEPERDVVAHRLREEERLLEDEMSGAAGHGDRALIRNVQTGEQAQQRGLSRPRCPDHRDGAASGDYEVEVA